jgi:hypothetical protein
MATLRTGGFFAVFMLRGHSGAAAEPNGSHDEHFLLFK